MKISLFVLFVFFQNFIYSQENLSYYFDNEYIENIKDYKENYSGECIYLSNSKDSTYNLLIKIGNNQKNATIDDCKKKWLVRFDANFKYNQVEDIQNLSNCRLFKVVEKTIISKRYKNYVEDFEFESDTINKKTIVHLKKYNNKKRKKIIDEKYYFFGNTGLNTNFNKHIKDYLMTMHNLDLHSDNLEKILKIENNKLVKETNFISIKKIDFNFSFKIDQVYPKNTYTSNTLFNSNK